MRKLIFGLFVVLAMQSCSEKLNQSIIADTKWILTEWPGETMPKTDKKALLNFNANSTISGKSFCNGFGGTVKINGEMIKFSDLLSTMMYCEDVGEAEGKFTAALINTNSFKLVNDKLQLLKDGKVLMIFNKTK